MYIGYIFDEAGYYNKPYYFKETIDSLVGFIDLNKDSKNVLVTDSNNNYVAEFTHGFVYKCKSSELEELLSKELMSVFKGVKKAEILHFAEGDRIFVDVRGDEL